MANKATRPFLHPQNDRIGDAGLDLFEYLNYYRFPPVYVTASGEKKDETPLCPHVRGRTHYAICPEDALYVYGERWCQTCRRSTMQVVTEPDGWVDPHWRDL